jgi:hypothetical protein
VDFMPVAKTFQSYSFESEPFELNGKKYIVVKNPKTNNTRTVRWYTEIEYNKLYPTEVSIATKEKSFKNLKKALGFDKGYITIFKNSSEHDEWFSMAPTRYHRQFGWYLISTEKDLEHLPHGVVAHKIYWDKISKNDTTLKPEAEIKEYIESILYSDCASHSTHVGAIGERLSLKVTITKTVSITTKWGEKIKYFMEDEKGNIFIWLTSPRSLKVSDSWIMRGTVKEHISEKNQKITVLTRCM